MGANTRPGQIDVASSSNGHLPCAPAAQGPPIAATAAPDCRAADCGEYASLLRDAIERFEGPLVRYAARITLDLERGRDVVQETFLRLCREPAIARTDTLPQWLFTVCRRLAIDVRRKETRMSTQLDATGVCEERQPTAYASTQNEEFEHVLRLLAALPASQQEVVRLKFQEQMSYKQIAVVTGLSVSNVGYLLHTAVMTLRLKMKEAG